MTTNDPHNEEHADGIVEDRKQAPPVYFNILFYGLILWGVLFIGWYLLSGWSSQGEFAEKMAAHTGTPVVEQSVSAPVATSKTNDAAELFADRCAGCHGSEGEGAFGPDLTESNYRYGRNKSEVRESIAHGRPKSMPAFASSLSAAEIDALTDYVLAL